METTNQERFMTLDAHMLYSLEYLREQTIEQLAQSTTANIGMYAPGIR